MERLHLQATLEGDEHEIEEWRTSNTANTDGNDVTLKDGDRDS